MCVLLANYGAYQFVYWPVKKSISKSRSTLARFMRVKQYAEHLNISERTLREWLYAGLVPYLKIQGHLILIDPIKADAALERLEKTEVKIK